MTITPRNFNVQKYYMNLSRFTATKCCNHEKKFVDFNCFLMCTLKQLITPKLLFFKFAKFMLSPNVYGFKLLQSVRQLLRSWLPLIQICLLAYVVAVFCISRSSFLPPHKVKLYIRTKLNLCTTYCRHLGLIASPNKSRQMDCLVRHFVSGHYKSSCNPFIFVFSVWMGFHVHVLQP